MHVQAPAQRQQDGRTSSETLDAYFARNNRPQPRYAGQGADAFQQALMERHAGVTPAVCDFYHTIELPDGSVHAGDWDLRGHEATYLGQVDVKGKRVIEFGPASGWMSAFIARQAHLTVVDLPFDRPPDFVPHPDIDVATTTGHATLSVGRLRNSWWYTKRSLGFAARAFYADIYQLPPDIGQHDIAFFGAILLHLNNPFCALQQAAMCTTEAIVVTDVDSSPRLPGYDTLAEGSPSLTVFNPTEPPFGMTHWWAVSPGMVSHMLRRLGFTEIAVTRHSPARMNPKPPMFTVIGRRPLNKNVAAPPVAGSADARDLGPPTDGLPIPPGPLRFSVSGTEDEDTFMRLGWLGFDALGRSIAAVGQDRAGLGRVLDFGCGVGRVTRYWADVPSVDVEGTDLAGDSIAWARANLPFADFGVNGLEPRLPYEDARFGLAYAFSVFTHLPRAMQNPWLVELGRVVRPGGLVYVTTHGIRYRNLLTPAGQAEFDRGEVVVTGGDQPGSNHCAAFHPEGWMRKVAASLRWTVVEHLPCGARGNPEQDSWLCRTAL